eukprot:6491344-Amphidinium_carterae.1
MGSATAECLSTLARPLTPSRVDVFRASTSGCQSRDGPAQHPSKVTGVAIDVSSLHTTGLEAFEEMELTSSNRSCASTSTLSPMTRRESSSGSGVEA